MKGNQIKKYAWLIDVLARHGKLTLGQIKKHWLASSVSEGHPLPDRTFYHMRRSVEEMFGIDISCTNYGEYYLENMDNRQQRSYTNWLLDTFAVNDAVQNMSATADSIMVENVPSAREFLSPIIQAIRSRTKIEFSYAGFNRSRVEEGIVYHPYFVRLYKQRWYMVGYKESARGLRTYALDRIKTLNCTNSEYETANIPSPTDFFSNTVGITTTEGAIHEVRLRVTPSQAKYFRVLPFHETQEEIVSDSYSIFSYRLKLNFELVHELLGLGSEVEVLAPRELQIMMAQELKKMLTYYDIGSSEPIPIK